MSKKKKAYLAGAIEAAPDQGKRWRTILSEQLDEMGWKYFNPCTETDGPILEELGWKKFKWEKIKTPKYRDEYLFVMNRIVEEDLKALLDCSCVIVYFDQYVPKGAGTYGELTIARHFNIPVYLVRAGDMEFNDIPAWVIGCTTKVFESFKDLRDFLREKDD
jgi:hypothetical protein